jgi:hypothetical protein
MHLPDHVALVTSDHHGAQLAQLYSLSGDWVEAIGDQHDELFDSMLDAFDCFQASTFDSTHGYYRSALSNLRSALELVAIGSLGNLLPNDGDYLRWKRRNQGSLPFPTCIGKLRRATKGTVPVPIFDPTAWLAALHRELCAYTHSRPDASDGEMWKSNGPIYVTEVFDKVFMLQLTTYAACFILAKIGRPTFSLPASSAFLFTSPGLLWRDDIALSHNALHAQERRGQSA